MQVACAPQKESDPVDSLEDEYVFDESEFNTLTATDPHPSGSLHPAHDTSQATWSAPSCKPGFPDNWSAPESLDNASFLASLSMQPDLASWQDFDFDSIDFLGNTLDDTCIPGGTVPELNTGTSTSTPLVQYVPSMDICNTLDAMFPMNVDGYTSSSSSFKSPSAITGDPGVFTASDQMHSLEVPSTSSSESIGEVNAPPASNVEEYGIFNNVDMGMQRGFLKPYS